MSDHKKWSLTPPVSFRGVGRVSVPYRYAIAPRPARRVLGDRGCSAPRARPETARAPYAGPPRALWLDCRSNEAAVRRGERVARSVQDPLDNSLAPMTAVRAEGSRYEYSQPACRNHFGRRYRRAGPAIAMAEPQSNQGVVFAGPS